MRDCIKTSLIKLMSFLIEGFEFKYNPRPDGYYSTCIIALELFNYEIKFVELWQYDILDNNELFKVTNLKYEIDNMKLGILIVSMNNQFHAVCVKDNIVYDGNQEIDKLTYLKDREVMGLVIVN